MRFQVSLRAHGCSARSDQPYGLHCRRSHFFNTQVRIAVFFVAGFLFSIPVLIAAGYVINKTRISCAELLIAKKPSSNFPCNFSDRLVYEKIAFSNVRKTWLVSLYGSVTALYSEEGGRWEFMDD